MVLDIVGLLISVPEFIWTIVNFFLLMFLLKIFLYNPVLKIMDERAKHIEEGLEEGRRAKQALDENTARFSAELSEENGKARELISEARSEAEKAKSEVIEAAHEEAEKLHKDVFSRIEAEEAEARTRVSDSMPELVAMLTDKLLGSENAGDAELIKSCIETSAE